MSITIAPTHDSIAAKMLRLGSPNYGYCLRCGLPWWKVQGHTTWYGTEGSAQRGCFPLCEGCWALLGHPEARIEYYAALCDEWDRDRPLDPETRRAIGNAVANETVIRPTAEEAK